MKKTRLVIAVSCLLVASVMFLAGETVYTTSIGHTSVVAYPALFFGLVGVVQLVRYAWR